MSIKVLHFLDSVNRGGTETQALDIARNAYKNDIDLLVVTSKGGELEDDFKHSGARFVRLKRKAPVDLALVSQLRRLVREHRIQVVQGHQAVDAIHLYLAARPIQRVIRVLSLQGFIPDRKNRLMLRFLIPRMSANIYSSEGLRDWLEKNDRLDSRLNSTVIFNCADPKRLEATGEKIRPELGVPGDAILLGMVGNFYRDPRKDHLTLVRSLPRIFEEFPTAHCLIVGGVEAGAEAKFTACREFCVQNNLAGRVHFLGRRDDVPEILAALDVFVFSSLHEGLPIAICEALLAKVPVVASDIPPHLELSENGRYVEIFKCRDHEELARKISGLLRDKAGRSALTQEAYRYAMDNFSVDAHLSNLRRLYERLLRQ